MALIMDADVIIRGERGTLDLAPWPASRPNDRGPVNPVGEIARRFGHTNGGLLHRVNYRIVCRHLKKASSRPKRVINEAAHTQWMHLFVQITYVTCVYRFCCSYFPRLRYR